MLYTAYTGAWAFKNEAVMSREAIDVGAFAWGRIQRLYDADAAVHWQRCEAEDGCGTKATSLAATG